MVSLSMAAAASLSNSSPQDLGRYRAADTGPRGRGPGRLAKDDVCPELVAKGRRSLGQDDGGKVLEASAGDVATRLAGNGGP